jgi:hypothetical protein
MTGRIIIVEQFFVVELRLRPQGDESLASRRMVRQTGARVGVFAPEREPGRGSIQRTILFSPGRGALGNHRSRLLDRRDRNNIFLIIGIRVTLIHSPVRTCADRDEIAAVGFFLGRGGRREFFVPNGRNPLKRLIPKK